MKLVFKNRSRYPALIVKLGSDPYALSPRSPLRRARKHSIKPVNIPSHSNIHHPLIFMSCNLLIPSVIEGMSVNTPKMKSSPMPKRLNTNWQDIVNRNHHQNSALDALPVVTNARRKPRDTACVKPTLPPWTFPCTYIFPDESPGVSKVIRVPQCMQNFWLLLTECPHFWQDCCTIIPTLLM